MAVSETVTDGATYCLDVSRETLDSTFKLNSIPYTAASVPFDHCIDFTTPGDTPICPFLSWGPELESVPEPLHGLLLHDGTGPSSVRYDIP